MSLRWTFRDRENLLSRPEKPTVRSKISLKWAARAAQVQKQVWHIWSASVRPFSFRCRLSSVSSRPVSWNRSRQTGRGWTRVEMWIWAWRLKFGTVLLQRPVSCQRYYFIRADVEKSGLIKSYVSLCVKQTWKKPGHQDHSLSIREVTGWRSKGHWERFKQEIQHGKSRWLDDPGTTT